VPVAAAVVAATPIPVRVETNGRLHLRYRVGERTVDDGRCGIDENWVETSFEAIEEAESDRLCRYCFPVQTGD
jgi:hypothetical protein